ncbi:MAG: rod shape-determining protein, rod shape-determining protein MreC [Candidatus Gottesmanbacteria bacterium GW2011_GWA2_43_14]|uniref:Cell shape-determining protein MreC n=1 Tax=Candidatus Gottesmanbacteria bacterium GW2011_GWA2_43_14 TaxID=1618443 RepID=A0A0G1DCF9_9BACT|nr:MAG: rod shape-determining protein, rod shape-determining protein MreC [Candidatus Gottesmanbacteria bacterium GW2011_GWA2_43_14]
MKKNYFLLVLLSLLILSFDYLSVLNPLKIILEKPVMLVKKELYTRTVSIRLLPYLLVNFEKLENQAEKLEENRRALFELAATVDELKNENDSLRKQLGSPLPSDFQFIPATVIASARFLELDAGSEAGIKTGMAVLDGSFLVGRIRDVSAYRSQVVLLTDEDIKVPAITDRGTRGRVSGSFNKSIVFNEVLQKDPLFLDDLVSTSGEEGFPPDLIIGKISHIDSDDAAVYKQAAVVSLAETAVRKKVFVTTRI